MAIIAVKILRRAEFFWYLEARAVRNYFPDRSSEAFKSNLVQVISECGLTDADWRRAYQPKKLLMMNTSEGLTNTVKLLVTKIVNKIRIGQTFF